MNFEGNAKILFLAVASHEKNMEAIKRIVDATDAHVMVASGHRRYSELREAITDNFKKHGMTIMFTPIVGDVDPSGVEATLASLKPELDGKINYTVLDYTAAFTDDTMQVIRHKYPDKVIKVGLDIHDSDVEAAIKMLNGVE